ncbi:MAG TPA: protein-disulfide reductase DsbD domain-containing protein [Flavobacteriaceae bacterium]
MMVVTCCNSVVWGQQDVDVKFKELVSAAAKDIAVAEPDFRNPVSVKSHLQWNSDKTLLAVMIKAKIMFGWHIYALVPKTQPYIQSKLILELPNGLTPMGDWELPAAFPYEQGNYTYQGEVVFIRYVKKQQPEITENIIAGLYYQTCDIKQCLPPRKETTELQLK